MYIIQLQVLSLGCYHTSQSCIFLYLPSLCLNIIKTKIGPRLSFGLHAAKVITYDYYVWFPVRANPLYSQHYK